MLGSIKFQPMVTRIITVGIFMVATLKTLSQLFTYFLNRSIFKQILPTISLIAMTSFVPSGEMITHVSLQYPRRCPFILFAIVELKLE